MSPASSGGADLPRRGLSVAVLHRQRRAGVRPERLKRVLRGAARVLRVRGELALVLTGDRAIQALNARYRRKNKATDVLSFPGDCAWHQRSGGQRESGRGCLNCAHGETNLGDVVISVETAARNAAAARRSLLQELDVLALHGFLHVLGYDHETDQGTMDRLETRLRRRLRLRA